MESGSVGFERVVWRDTHNEGFDSEAVTGHDMPLATCQFMDDITL